jgi:hypothetical protein
MPFDGLTDDQIRQAAPSVFATHASSKVSDRYAYLPSYHVVRSMRSLGFQPVEVRQGVKKAPDGREYAMHEIRFEKAGVDWANQTKELGMIVPQALFRNSHDRTSGADMSAGLKRLVCLNGMTVMDSDMRFSVRHTGRELTGNFLGAVQSITSQFARVVEVAKRWQKIELSPDQTRAFAMKALELRGTTIEVPEQHVLWSRRALDNGADLWSVFNRAQENMTRGGAQGRSAKGAWRAVQGIKSLAVDIDFNKKLWSAAADLAETVQPAPRSVVVA